MPPSSVSLPALPVSVSLPAAPVSTLAPALPRMMLFSVLPVPSVLLLPVSVRFSTFAPKVKFTLDCTRSMPPAAAALVSVTVSPELSTT